MKKIKIRLPATMTNLGPGLHSLGLALGLYTSVEISGRTDQQIVLETSGEGANRYPISLKHPVVLGIGRFFQHLEKAHLGINIRVENQIPLQSGLGAEAAMMMAGILGANFLMNNLYKRTELLEIAAESIRPDHVVTTVLGGLTASLMREGELIYRTLPVTPVKLIVVVPQMDNYKLKPLPERVALADTLHNISAIPILLEALRVGDLKLLANVVEDKLNAPRIIAAINGFNSAVEAGRRMGALAVTVIGDGPALLALAENRHERIADEIRLALREAGVTARTWVLPIDTQGVVISAMQSA